MIKLKTKDEIKILREGGRKLAAILDEVARKAVPGAKTGELEALACRLIAQAGGRAAFKGLDMANGRTFPTALCTSINSEIVHAPALPSRTLKEGDIIGIDIGMEYPVFDNDGPEAHGGIGGGRPWNKYSRQGGYYTDTAKTVVVGRADRSIDHFVRISAESLERAIKKVRPGNTLDDIGREIQDFVETRGMSVVRELVGHGVGYKIHEDPQVPHYRLKGSGMKNIALEPGLVIAIEPMINMGGPKIRLAADGFTYETADGSLSSQFEHTVAVTDTGCEILTAR